MSGGGSGSSSLNQLPAPQAFSYNMPLSSVFQTLNNSSHGVSDSKYSSTKENIQNHPNFFIGKMVGSIQKGVKSKVGVQTSNTHRETISGKGKNGFKIGGSIIPILSEQNAFQTVNNSSQASRLKNGPIQNGQPSIQYA